MKIKLINGCTDTSTSPAFPSKNSQTSGKYALERISIDIEDGLKIVKKLMHDNFYKYDLIKLVKTPDEAVELIKQTRCLPSEYKFEVKKKIGINDEVQDTRTLKLICKTEQMLLMITPRSTEVSSKRRGLRSGLLP